MSQLGLQPVEGLGLNPLLVTSDQVADVLADVFIGPLIANIGRDIVAQGSTDADGHCGRSGHGATTFISRVFNITKKAHKTSYRYLLPKPLVVWLLDNVAARKRNVEHGIRVPHESDQMVTAWPPFAREPVFHSALAGARPAPGRLDRPMCFAQFLVQSQRYSGSITNYGARYREGRRIASTAAEANVNNLVARRMVKKQQMRWSVRWANLLLQVRVALANGDLAERLADRPPVRPRQTIISPYVPVPLFQRAADPR